MTDTPDNRRPQFAAEYFERLAADNVLNGPVFIALRAAADLARHLADVNLPFEDADPRITIYRNEGYFGYRIDDGGDTAPFKTWREAYRAAAGNLDLIEKDRECERLRQMIGVPIGWTDQLSRAIAAEARESEWREKVRKLANEWMTMETDFADYYFCGKELLAATSDEPNAPATPAQSVRNLRAEAAESRESELREKVRALREACEKDAYTHKGYPKAGCENIHNALAATADEPKMKE